MISVKSIARQNLLTHGVSPVKYKKRDVNMIWKIFFISLFILLTVSLANAFDPSINLTHNNSTICLIGLVPSPIDRAISHKWRTPDINRIITCFGVQVFLK